MYKTQSADTTEEAERVQMAMLRGASVAKRAQRMNALSCFVIEASRRAIERAHPEWSRREVLLFWVRQHYGEEVGEALACSRKSANL